MLTILKLYRLSKGIKAKELAQKSLLSISMISKIESGKVSVSTKAKQRIAKALGVSEEALFGKI